MKQRARLARATLSRPSDDGSRNGSPDEKEVRMKLGPHLLAILAFGAWSTTAGVAAHRHAHHGTSGAAASQSGANAPSLAKSPTAAGRQQGSGPAVQGGVADHGNGGAAKGDSGLTGTGKAIVDDVGPGTRNSAKTGVSSNPAPPGAAAAHGLNHAATPGTGGETGAAGIAIDTSITVHQVRATINTIKQRLFNKPKTAVTAAIGVKHEHVNNHRQAAPAGSDGGLHRNAIGAVVGHDKPIAHGNAPALGAAAPMSTTPAAPPAANTLADPATKSAAASAPIANAKLGTESIIHHGPGAGAIGVGSANGPSINGTGIGRPWLGAGAIGGPAKIVGVLNGTAFRTRHP